jgi:Ca2+-binding RTX toxin-like protein
MTELSAEPEDGTGANIMAIVNGTNNPDFIHRSGDGNTPPVGFTDITGVTTGDDTIDGRNGDDIIFADDGNDDIFGGAGDDTIDGGLGNDLLDGGLGADALTGGGGDDTYIVDNVGDTAVEGAGGGTDTVQASVSFKLGAEVDNLTLTGTAVTGAGNGLANTIQGNEAANTLRGGGGSDILTGGAGIDKVKGGSGGDTLRVVNLDVAAGDLYDGGSGTDTLDGSGSVNLTTSTLLSIENLGFFVGLTMTAAQLDAITGTINTGAIALADGGAVDISDASVSTRTFFLSAAGNSLTLTNAAAYTVHGGAAADTVTILGGTKAASLRGNNGNDALTGGGGNDALTGGGGNDALTGGFGNDVLIGDAGDDTMTGGSGGDFFRFTPGPGSDTIADFSGDTAFSGGPGQNDTIQIFFGPAPGSGSYIGADAFTNTGELQMRFAGAEVIQVDTNGDTTADFQIKLTGMTSAGQLTNSDFFFG